MIGNSIAPLVVLYSDSIIARRGKFNDLHILLLLLLLLCAEEKPRDTTYYTSSLNLDSCSAHIIFPPVIISVFPRLLIFRPAGLI
jgi:hypothetical protein